MRHAAFHVLASAGLVVESVTTEADRIWVGTRAATTSAACPRRIFDEPLAAHMAARAARRTSRLARIVHHLGVALGGRPAASLARRLMLPVSRDTLLHTRSRNPGHGMQFCLHPDATMLSFRRFALAGRPQAQKSSDRKLKWGRRDASTGTERESWALCAPVAGIMKIAVIGAGLVGSAWAIVFARGGCEVALYDAADGAVDRSLKMIAARLSDLERNGLIADPHAIEARIVPARQLTEALDGAAYAQESVFETKEQKQAVFREIDRVVGSDTIVGSSSSGIPASAFTEALACRARCLIAHPANPPYLIPVVELVPAPWTAPEAVAWVRALMERVGQEPVQMTRELEGFILNRLQGVLLMEAWRLVADGYASVADIDRTVSSGLGLRWSFMGPFETIDLNAPDGVADYARRLGPLYHSIVASRTEHERWSEALILEIERQRRDQLPAQELAERSAWRDRRLMALAVHKRLQAKVANRDER